MEIDKIKSKLPYNPPFLFVDDLLEINENGAKGSFTYSDDLDFYKGHFKNNPVTPGVILIETMAQIGVVCLGIYLISNTKQMNCAVAFTSSNVEFLKPVFPNEKVTVTSEKMYFRFGKLKCKVQMTNSNNEVVCTGEIAGMLIPENDE